MSLSSISLPKPKNWQDFERATRVLFECVLGDPNVQLNGRSGQSQHGIDVYGHRSDGRMVGIQCKQKLGSSVNDDELRSEVEKAQAFRPALDEFILVTTAQRDQKIQETARLITGELATTDHPIHVSVWGWEDVEEYASEHARAWRAFDPTYSPVLEEGLRQVQAGVIGEMRGLLEEMQAKNSPGFAPTTVSLSKGDKDTPRHGEISVLHRLVDNGDVQTALKGLLRLRNDEWDDSSKFERYRILVGIASAKLKLGREEEAGALLLDAYREFPEHTTARRNLATGYLLVKQHGKAESIAREALAEDDSDADTAGTLIQALMPNEVCQDPLTDVPQDLHETEEVMIAHVYFQRCRGNPDWVELAREAAAKHLDSKTLKKFAAEAVLDELVKKDPDVIAGVTFKNPDYDEVNDAVETLYSEACSVLDNDLSLAPSTAHNTALGLRIIGDLVRAREILEAAVSQHPDNESLRLQLALVIFADDDPAGALAVLPDRPSDPEAIGLKVAALEAIGDTERAIAVIDETDEDTMPEHVQFEFLSVKLRGYVAQGKQSSAIELIERRVAEDPGKLTLKTLQIRTYRMVLDSEDANAAFNEALLLVDDKTALTLRLRLSFEARKLGRNDAIVSLLRGRVATDRENEGLRILLEASINSGAWITARNTLETLSEDLRSTAWFQRAEVILAINSGDAIADEKIERYLNDFPKDLNVLMARVGIWQTAGRDSDIRDYLQSLSLENLDGPPELRIWLAGLVSRYDEAARGLQYGYSVLMDNWNNSEAHLAYQGFLFLNETIGEAMPSAYQVAENTVVCLRTNDSEQRYRIERERHVAFEDERVSPEEDLAVILLGKRPGDVFKLHDRIGAEPVEVLWIKSIYLDALHCSLEQFDKRFPRADGLLKLSYESSAPDTPEELGDLKKVVKAQAKAAERILEEYRSKGLSLSFAAKLLGRDVIDAYDGLAAIGAKFQVCVGTAQERQKALDAIEGHNKRGCVLDAITLSVVHKLGVEGAVWRVCGPVHTSQSVIELFAARALEARGNVGKTMGCIAWHEGRLVSDEYSEEDLTRIADEREEILEWVRAAASIVPAMPKTDLSPDVRKLIDTFGREVCDPAFAADGNDLLLISEDKGYRHWSNSAFGLVSAWLQPVLMVARSEGYLSTQEYCEAINALALSGHTHVSLDHHCLMHEARRGDFRISKDLSYLLGTGGGPLADLGTNCRVFGTFIDVLLQECPDQSKSKRVVSEAFSAISKGRREDQRLIILLILWGIRTNRAMMQRHALGWLIGHSLGMPYFNELLQMAK